MSYQKADIFAIMSAAVFFVFGSEDVVWICYFW